jgi:hypothetical protein
MMVEMYKGSLPWGHIGDMKQVGIFIVFFKEMIDSIFSDRRNQE